MGRREGWSWNSNTLATWGEELTHWKRPWCWDRLKAGGEGDDRGWDGWMASPTQWTWVWGNSRRWWNTEEPGLPQPMGLQSQTQLSNWTATNDIQIAARKRFSVFPVENFSSESKLNQASKGPLKVHQGFHYFQLGWFFSAFSCIQNTECHQWIRSLFSRTLNSMLLSNYIPRSFSSVKPLILGCLFHLKILCIHNVNMMAQVNNEFYWKESFVVFYWNAEGLQGG